MIQHVLLPRWPLCLHLHSACVAFSNSRDGSLSATVCDQAEHLLLLIAVTSADSSNITQSLRLELRTVASCSAWSLLLGLHSVLEGLAWCKSGSDSGWYRY